MVLPGFFSKSSTEKKSTSDSKDRIKPAGFSISPSSSRSPSKSPIKSPTKSPTKSPAKSSKDREPRSIRKDSGRRNSPRQLYTTDTHPLNLPPDERERRRSAMEGPSEASSMEIDQDGTTPSVPSSPLPMTPGAFQEMNGGTYEDRMSSDTSPVPPPHGPNTTSLPSSQPSQSSQPPQPAQPAQPAVDPEACKSLGNKYFIAKDYTKAIKEYTKGGHPPWTLVVVILCFVYKTS